MSDGTCSVVSSQVILATHTLPLGVFRCNVSYPTPPLSDLPHIVLNLRHLPCTYAVRFAPERNRHNSFNNQWTWNPPRIIDDGVALR